jgi:hypothetical protein
MKNLLFTILISIISSGFVFADEGPELKGNIGGYEIEMILEPIDFLTGEFTGKYKYLSQENYLRVEGNIYDKIVIIDEFYDNTKTGTFYLERTNDSFSGKWYGNEKHFNVELKISKGTESDFQVANEEFATRFSSDSITGTYKISYYSLSDLLVPDDSYPPDLIQSGGIARFEEIDNNHLKFKIEMIYGPTAHWAGAEGVAVKEGESYVYTSESRENEKCIIYFTFGNKKVHAKAIDSNVCGFGARAHLDDILYKVYDGLEDF